MVISRAAPVRRVRNRLRREPGPPNRFKRQLQGRIVSVNRKGSQPKLKRK
jgi:hypothetical protein